MRIIEHRYICGADIRNSCITENWYTRGTNAEYMNLLSKYEYKKYSVRTLYNIAKDIYEHSDFNRMKESGYFEHDIIENIMFILSRKIVSTYEILED